MQGAASSIFQHGEKHRDVIDTYGKKKEKRKKKKIGEKRKKKWNGTALEAIEWYGGSGTKYECHEGLMARRLGIKGG